MEKTLDTHTQKWNWPVYLAIVLGIHVVFFVLQCILNHPFTSDSHQYLAIADNLWNHGTFYGWDLNEPIDMQGYSQRPPGYPFFLLPFRMLTSSIFPILVLQILVSTATFWGLFKIWQELDLKVHPLWGVIPALIFFPAQLIYANMVMSEILFQAFVFWAFYFMIRFFREPLPKYLLFYNLLLCAGLLTKPVLYLFWIPNLVILGWLAYKHKKFQLILLGILPIIAITAWCGLNYARTGYYHFSSITSINLLNYNASRTLLAVYGEEKEDSIIVGIMEHSKTIADFKERETYMKGEATRLIMEHKGAYAKQHLKGMVNFFVDPGRFDLYTFFGLQEEGFQGLLYYFSKDGYPGIFQFFKEQPAAPALSLILIMVWNLVLLLALLNFLFLRKVPWEIRVLALLLIGYICAATGPLGASRFKIPIYPLLVLTIPFLWERIQQLFRRFKPGGIRR